MRKVLGQMGMHVNDRLRRWLGRRAVRLGICGITVVALLAASIPLANAAGRGRHRGGRPTPPPVASASQPAPAAPSASAAAPGPVVTLPAGPTAPDDAAPIGGNLNGQPNYSLDFAFTDAMKTAGLYRQASNSDAPAPLDARGWPTADFAVFVSESEIPTGTYHLSYESGSQPTVEPLYRDHTVTNASYDAAAGRGSADITITGPGAHFVLKFTNTVGGARNIRLIRPGYDPANPPTFTTPFLNSLRTVGPASLRFMDFAETNMNLVRTWAERTKVDDARQTSEITRDTPTGSFTKPKGIAWEYVIELANLLRVDPWINVPSEADDDYVSNLATLFRDKLAPDLHVYVENSNELWNYAGAFQQTMWNLAATNAEVATGNSNLDDLGGDQYMWSDRRAARRSTEISNIFARQFGAGAVPNGRVRPVLAGFFVNVFRSRLQLEYINAVYGAPSKFFHATAGAPYFYSHEIDKRTDVTKDEMLDALAAGVEDTLSTQPHLRDQVAVARQYGLKYLAYEGGPDTYGDRNIQAKKAAHLDPRMGVIVERFLKLWFAGGGDLFIWFTLGATSYDTQHGAWGVSNDINNTATPKIQALRTIRNTPLTQLRSG